MYGLFSKAKEKRQLCCSDIINGSDDLRMLKMYENDRTSGMACDLSHTFKNFQYWRGGGGDYTP